MCFSKKSIKKKKSFHFYSNTIFFTDAQLETYFITVIETEVNNIYLFLTPYNYFFPFLPFSFIVHIYQLSLSFSIGDIFFLTFQSIRAVCPEINSVNRGDRVRRIYPVRPVFPDRCFIWRPSVAWHWPGTPPSIDDVIEPVNDKLLK